MQRISGDDDPQRCQGMTANGQCRYLKQPSSDFCIMHGGNKGAEALANKQMKNYRLTKFKARAEQLSNNPSINSLRDEVAILRILIEEKVNVLIRQLAKLTLVLSGIKRIPRILSKTFKLQFYRNVCGAPNTKPIIESGK